MPPHALSEVRKLAIAGGVFFMFCTIVGLAKAGVPSRLLFSLSPMFWLAGIIACGLLLRLCDSLGHTSRRPQNVRFPEPEWDASLATSELGVFIGPRSISSRATNHLSQSPNGSSISQLSITRKSSLPQYDELFCTSNQQCTVHMGRNEIDTDNGSCEYTYPPSYSEAILLCQTRDSK